MSLSWGSDAERAESRKYVEHELTDMLSGLASELAKYPGIPKAETMKLGKEAIENTRDGSTGTAKAD